MVLNQTDRLQHTNVCHGAKYVIFSQIHIQLTVMSDCEFFNSFVYLG